MKKLLTLAASVAIISGCTTTGTIHPVSPQQLVAQFCPVVQAINSQILILPNLDPLIASKINEAKPIVQVVCADGAALSASDLKSLSVQAIPLLIDAVSATAVAATPQGQAIVLGLNIASITISQIIESKSLVAAPTSP